MDSIDERLTGKKQFRRVKRFLRKPYFVVEVEVHCTETYFTAVPDNPNYGSTAIIDTYYWRNLRPEDLEITPHEVEIKGSLIC